MVQPLRVAAPVVSIVGQVRDVPLCEPGLDKVNVRTAQVKNRN